MFLVYFSNKINEIVTLITDEINSKIFGAFFFLSLSFAVILIRYFFLPGTFLQSTFDNSQEYN